MTDPFDGFFTFCPQEGFATHQTAGGARAIAEDHLRQWLDSPDVPPIAKGCCWGSMTVLGSVRISMVPERIIPATKTLAMVDIKDKGEKP